MKKYLIFDIIKKNFCTNMWTAIFLLSNFLKIKKNLSSPWLHDNSNSENSNSYEIFQGAISQNII